MPNNDSRDAQWFLQRLPERSVLKSVLKDDPVERLLGVVRDRAIVKGGDDLMPKQSAEEAQVAAMLQTATAAAKRLTLDPATVLTKEEKDAIDLFNLLLSRPAILVKKGTVTEDPENWPDIKRESELLPPVIAGVGRIELADHFKMGTGFIVGENRILTNNHVVCGLLGLHQMDWKDRRKLFQTTMDARNQAWADDPTTQPRFELRGEFGSAATRSARITRILGSHEKVDMAVLALDTTPKGAQRVTLATASPKKFKGHRMYVVGYPVKDLGNPRAPLPILRRVFGQDDSLGMKRFSPGTVLEWQNDLELKHDASTLAGSSGSCLVDFNDHRVFGLHFSGRYDTSNYAVPLWKFKKDVLLTGNGVIFGEE